MSKKLVVDAEWLLELLPENYPFPPQTVEQMIQEQEDYTLDGREVIRPLTPAEERAGDEEWVVVNKAELKELFYSYKYCPGERGNKCPLCGTDERSEYDCADCWVDYITTPGAERGGRA